HIAFSVSTYFFFLSHANHRNLHSFPTRRSSDLKQIDNEMKRLQGQIADEMGRCCTAVYSRDGTDYTITYNPLRKPGINKENLYRDRKSTRLNSSHVSISYAVFCLKKKKQNTRTP